MRDPSLPALALAVGLLATAGCHGASAGGAAPDGGGSPADAIERACELVASGVGPAGTVPVKAEVVAAGLEVPWGLAFLPGGDLLVTERPGRVRLVRGGQLVETPVATLPVRAVGEGGLLGIALHPDFATNRLFYLYYTVDRGGSPVNRIERWQLAADGSTATADRVIADGIAAGNIHNGGRLRFGPDGMLYASTGEAGDRSRSQSLDSLNGKLLRLTPDGEVPADNPFPGNPVFLLGIRNSEGFDWREGGGLYVADHGPTGEMGLSGRDEVNFANAGDNLGWPEITACETRAGMVAPALTWTQAVPPGGAAWYTGSAIPEWQGSLLVATLGSRHLHRVVFAPGAPARVASHEVYFEGDPPAGFGRLRDILTGPDGALYVTTSNCDGRGTCPPEKDAILRVSK